VLEGLFADRLEAFGVRPAVIAGDGSRWSYGELAQAADRAAAALQGPPGLVIVEAANTLACVVAYLACLRARFPVLLAEPGSTARDPRIADAFHAAYVFCETEEGGWHFVARSTIRVLVHPDLCVLLSTSGSTGSPKLVRLSRQNIESNAAAIADYLDIGSEDRALTALPLFYSYGMSVLNSHLHAGACLLLTEDSVASDSFWKRLERDGATSLAGVPFTFDILERIGFRTRRYPSLRYLTQAGGRMATELVRTYAEWAASQHKQFFVMYGQTEAAPRMAYVPPAQLKEDADAIGIAIPGGSFELLNELDQVEERIEQPGELVYRGPNVMMGYAESASDLALGKLVYALYTGDMACRKANGSYRIVGRLSRFSKIIGLRVSLDDLERWLEQQGIKGAVGGDDELIAVGITRRHGQHELKQRMIKAFGLPEKSLEVVTVDPLPTRASGKVDHHALLRQVRATAGRDKGRPPESLLQGYADILGTSRLRPRDSFLDLGGDSVCFVEVSLLLENYLGYLPDNWQAMPIAALEGLKQPGIVGEGQPPRRRWSFALAAAIALAIMVAGEGALQTRAYLKTGRSAAALLTGRGTVIFNEEWGVRTYRPNNVLEVPSRQVRFETNSLGLRSPEIQRQPGANELRVAVAGASTVAGAYAKRNSDTFSSLLEKQLRSSHPQQPVNVINGGIEGHTLRETRILVEKGLIGLHPSLVIIYPGFNDITNMCHVANGTSHRQPLPSLGLPNWVLSRELVSKNTVLLRTPPHRADRVDPATRFSPEYVVTLRELIHSLRKAHIEPVLMTVARAFKGIDKQQGSRLAETALYYNSCLDYEGLVKAGELYNSVITKTAREEHVNLLDLAQAMPAGRRYFVDAGHFNAEGERFVADYLARELDRRHLVPPRFELSEQQQ
jgi:acyl-CoA synthetase (AMP-forming)/AMP-acid ligase II/lysophospholipase L1-like esterase